MMLGGVGFQAGLDEARRKQAPAVRADVAEQLKGLKALLDDGALTPGEFQKAKRIVLGR
jgi:hypothetical protein